jgi:Zn-dependent peptidase ImmA (M78 family)
MEDDAVPEGGVAVTVREAERDAARLLDTSWWRTSQRDDPLPVDPMELARGLGIEVRTVPLPADESGNIVIPADDEAVISLNRWDARNRQRFTCAHEVGHYLRRQRSTSARRTYVDYRDTLAGLGRDVEEIYANQFAAALLMPAHLVQRFYIVERWSVEDMAETFETSTQAMNLRLRNLRLF